MQNNRYNKFPNLFIQTFLIFEPKRGTVLHILKKDFLSQAEASQTEIPLEGASYPNSDFSPNSYESLGTGQYSVLTNVVVTVAPPQYGAQTTTVSNVYALTTGDYYREVSTESFSLLLNCSKLGNWIAIRFLVLIRLLFFFPQYYAAQPADQYAQAVRHHLAAYQQDNSENSVYVDRYIRQNYKNSPHGLTVDLPSPDSGIGETTVTPRDSIHQVSSRLQIHTQYTYEQGQYFHP